MQQLKQVSFISVIIKYQWTVYSLCSWEGLSKHLSIWQSRIKAILNSKKLLAKLKITLSWWKFPVNMNDYHLIRVYRLLLPQISLKSGVNNKFNLFLVTKVEQQYAAGFPHHEFLGQTAVKDQHRHWEASHTQLGQIPQHWFLIDERDVNLQLCQVGKKKQNDASPSNYLLVIANSVSSCLIPRWLKLSLFKSLDRRCCKEQHK